MSTAVKIGCACGGYIEVEAERDDYFERTALERWEQEHEGHGADAVLTAEVKAVKRRLNVASRNQPQPTETTTPSGASEQSGA